MESQLWKYRKEREKGVVKFWPPSNGGGGGSEAILGFDLRIFRVLGFDLEK